MKPGPKKQWRPHVLGHRMTRQRDTYNYDVNTPIGAIAVRLEGDHWEAWWWPQRMKGRALVLVDRASTAEQAALRADERLKRIIKSVVKAYAL